MLGIIGWINGLIATINILLACILGFFFIYKSKKTEAKLLFYAGITTISLSFVLLGNCFDFITILITNRNTHYSLYKKIIILNCMATGPGILAAYYISYILIFGKKEKFVLIFAYIIIIVYEIILFFEFLYFNSFDLVYPKESGENLIETYVIVGSPFQIVLFIAGIYGLILNVLGLLFKAVQSTGILRKKYSYLSIGFMNYILTAFLLNIISFNYIFFFLTSLLLYFGLRVESSLIKTKKNVKELEIKDFIFRLDDSERKLRESEEKYRLITENATDLITIFNDKFEIEYINEKIHKRLLSYSKDDLIGKKIIGFTHPLDEKNILNMQKVLLQNEEGTTEIRVMKKDHSYIWLNIKANIFFNENREKKVLTVSTDVSEYKRAQEIIREENFRLKKIDELRKEFMARATHDIKDPLSSVILTMDMLLDMYDNKDFNDFRNNFIDVTAQIKKVKDFAINLLDYTLLEMHQSQIKKEKVNLSKIIFNTIQNEKVRAKERGIEIVSNLPEDLYLFGDTIGLTQIFQNILSNAINYTPDYGNSKIIINVERNDSKIKFSVKDNGIGISSEDMNKIFEWGQKINYNRKDITFGSGIGLYITKKLLETYGGNIWAESEGIGKGSTFFIEFPIKN